MWYQIILLKQWFGEMFDRYKLITDFNTAAKEAFIAGEAPTLLKARITRGEAEYRHMFSKWMAGGFRIKAMSGKPLKNYELVEIGKTILNNEELTRKLVTLGWDTLEIHANEGNNGVKWSLKKFIKFGKVLGQ
jgi:hypothetical protein